VQLKDKVVVITGSGNGIGEAMAKRFSDEGAKVVVTDIDPVGVERIAGEISSVGLVADITVEEDVRRVAALARDTYGRVDVWYSNAGFSGPRQPGEIQDNSLWELGWNLHVMSHVFAVREVLPEMLQRGDGYLLQTASSVALSTQAEKASYSVTKHAALALSEWLAVTYRSRGIRVSCFCPGPMLTQMLLGNDFPPDHPVLRMALRPDQVADLVTAGIAEERFLILDRSDTTEDLAAKAADYDGWVDSFGAKWRGTVES
jgi:NAD(P)-dependent dehydrogenase (short-subunit alcohol dehydrogenase family)